ncbi:MAG: FAD:protein FMN transferase [Clostridia bacterium]|nr:FAD:protein FMN transferase [Clostridia bacterium]
MKKLIAIIVVMACLCCGCAAKRERTDFALDTVVNVTVYDAKNEDVLDECFAEIERLEALFSATRENSDIARINASRGKLVTVSDETAALIKAALNVSLASEGAFDITVRPVSKLWDFTADNPTLPDADALREALSRVDYRQVQLYGDNNVMVDGEIELGGIAKGYIADCVEELLRARGVRSALIDLGGNIVAVGDKDGTLFRIGVKDPQNTGALAVVVQVRDCSVVTSGTYERGFTLDGVRYHHLLDPKTGMPVQNGLASVTIVCESSTMADALSTACFVLGEKKARALLTKFSATEAIFIYDDGRITTTDGWRQNDDGEYILSQN